MKIETTTSGYCYIDDDQEFSFELNKKIYVEYTVCMRFKPKDKIDKRSIYVYSLNMFTKTGRKKLQDACDRS